METCSVWSYEDLCFFSNFVILLTFFFPFPISRFYFKALIYNFCVSLNKNWLDLTTLTVPTNIPANCFLLQAHKLWLYDCQSVEVLNGLNDQQALCQGSSFNSKRRNNWFRWSDHPQTNVLIVFSNCYLTLFLLLMMYLI